MGVEVDQARVDELMKRIHPREYLGEDEKGVTLKATELEEIAKVPVNLMMLCALTGCTNAPIPSSKAAMYAGVFAKILAATSPSNPVVNTALIEKVWCSLPSLSNPPSSPLAINPAATTSLIEKARCTRFRTEF
jgi:hypothetical protein